MLSLLPLILAFLSLSFYSLSAAELELPNLGGFIIQQSPSGSFTYIHTQLTVPSVSFPASEGDPTQEYGVVFQAFLGYSPMLQAGVLARVNNTGPAKYTAVWSWGTGGWTPENGTGIDLGIAPEVDGGLGDTVDITIDVTEAPNPFLNGTRTVANITIACGVQSTTQFMHGPATSFLSGMTAGWGVQDYNLTDKKYAPLAHFSEASFTGSVATTSTGNLFELDVAEWADMVQDDRAMISRDQNGGVVTVGISRTS